MSGYPEHMDCPRCKERGHLLKRGRATKTRHYRCSTCFLIYTKSDSLKGIAPVSYKAAVPSRTPPEWKPLIRDFFSHAKLAMTTRK